MAVIEMLDPDNPAAAGRRWEIDAATVIGRGGEADIVLAVSAMSRHHVELRPEPHGWVARDLDSRNGTYLNDRPVEPGADHRLGDGDRLVLAGSVTLRFRDPMATPEVPRIGRLTGVWIDADTGSVWVDAQPVEPPLTTRQLALLMRLYEADGAVVSRADLIAAAWPDQSADGVTDDALAALIKRLRKRLAHYEAGDPVIEILRHRGVRLSPGR
jgi:hypothetical protein